MKYVFATMLLPIGTLLSGCGGGGDGGTVAADTQAPTLSGVTASAPTAGQVTLTASASDNTQVTGYCFKASSATPAVTDACFQADATKPVTLAVPNLGYFVWAKDAVGNVSVPLSVRGPCSTAGYAASDLSTRPTVCLATSLGQFVIALESAKAPVTTANFLKYTADGFYAGTVFHRVLATFMVQAGGFTSDLKQKPPTYPAITLETSAVTGLSNTKGTVAMARTNVLNSATSQFFINVVDNTALDTSNGGYAAFGQVIFGLDSTIETIRAVPVAPNSGGEVSQPVTLPVIAWAYQLK
ncbi:MAG: peptidylprolyl isomerase [Rhodoferax sp.]